jgi:hypothetical protein
MDGCDQLEKLAEIMMQDAKQVVSVVLSVTRLMLIYISSMEKQK